MRVLCSIVFETRVLGKRASFDREIVHGWINVRLRPEQNRVINYTMKMSDAGDQIAVRIDEGLYRTTPTVVNIEKGQFGRKGRNHHELKVSENHYRLEAFDN